MTIFTARFFDNEAVFGAVGLVINGAIAVLVLLEPSI
jgi:hypothetical protein